MFQSDSLDLTIQVPADEWAYAQRRNAYLEALLLRVVRERAHIQEWYDAAELAALHLPGLPASRAGVARKASTGHWQSQRVLRGGRWRNVYHVASLPSRAFDALIARILDMPDLEADIGALPDLRAPAMARPAAENMAPPWVLPLMRLLKDNCDLGEAWDALPDHLPDGVAVPTIEEAAETLVRFGLA